MDTNHYENYWVDTSGYQQQWVDTSHWQARWVDTSHYDVGQYTVGDSYITSPTWVNSGYTALLCHWEVDDNGVRSRECDDFWQSTAYTAYPNQTWVPPTYTTVTDQIPAVHNDWTETIPAVTHTVTTTIPAVTHTATVHHDAVTHTVTTHYAAVTHTESVAVAASTHQSTLSFDATVVPDPASGTGDSSLADFAALMGLVAAAGAGRLFSTRDVLRQTLANWSASGRAVPVSIACLATDTQISDQELSTQLTSVLTLTDPHAAANVLGNVDDGSDPPIDVGLSESLTVPGDLTDNSGVLSAIAALSQSVFSGLLQPVWDSAVALIKQFLQWFSYGLADAERDLDSPNWLVKASAMLVIVPAAVAVSAGAVASATGAAALARVALSGSMAALRFLVAAGRALQTGLGSALAFIADKFQSVRNWLFGMQDVVATAASRLTQRVVDSFAGGPRLMITTRPMVVDRYWGNSSPEVSNWFTTRGTSNLILTSDDARAALNLLASGNNAQNLTRYLVPPPGRRSGSGTSRVAHLGQPNCS